MDGASRQQRARESRRHEGRGTSGVVRVGRERAHRALLRRRARHGRFVALKAHGSPAFYAIQYLRGRLSADDLRALRSFGGLQAYPSHRKNPEIVDLSTGSMGLGAVEATFGALATRYLAIASA
jgi:pyruvate dehydrogenase complex dehydrogenase (E1) component